MEATPLHRKQFFKAFEHIEDFKGESHFYTWRVRITVNQALCGSRRSRLFLRHKE